MDEALRAGAVVAGRGTVEPAGWCDGDHHDGVPVFILIRTKTAADVEQWPLITVLGEGRRLFAQSRPEWKSPPQSPHTPRRVAFAWSCTA